MIGIWRRFSALNSDKTAQVTTLDRLISRDSSHLGGIALDLMMARLAPDDQPNARRRGALPIYHDHGSWVLQSFLAVIVCIVVIAARELHEHTGLVAYRPRIMTGRQQHDVVLREILLRTIVHNDPERSRKDECHVRQLTAVRSCKFLQIA